jgi:putative addiction module component (TIGR02574 family)
MATMQMTDKIYELALDLPTDDRMILIDKLLHSANLPTQREVDKLWAEEVERRNEEIESGSSRLIPGEEVFSKIKKRFGK